MNDPQPTGGTIRPATSTSKPHSFTISSRNLTVEVHGRDAAVHKAKAISRQRPAPVVVERKDRRIEMTFRRGSIQEYRFATRRSGGAR